MGALTGFTNGIDVTGGTLTVGGVSESNGNVCGIPVSGSAAQITVNGSITNSGSLTVSGGR